MFPDFTPSRSLTDLSVLLVEDNPTSRMLILRLLNSLGYDNVTVANDGEEALSFLDSAGGAPDLILCDWQMPGIDGLTVLGVVRALFKDAIFIMVTATNSIEAAMLAKAHGADGYLLKPVTRENLAQTIEGAVRRAHATHD